MPVHKLSQRKTRPIFETPWGWVKNYRAHGGNGAGGLLRAKKSLIAIKEK